MNKLVLFSIYVVVGVTGELDVVDSLTKFEKAYIHWEGRNLRNEPKGTFNIELVLPHRKLKLSLEKDTSLFSSTYELLVDEGLVPLEDLETNCIYKEGSGGMFSFCHDGVSGSHNHLYIKNSEKQSGLVAFNESDILIDHNKTTCGQEGEEGSDDPSVGFTQGHKQERREYEYEEKRNDNYIREGAMEESPTKFVKLLLVSDLKRFQTYGSHQSLMQSLKAIASQLKQIYDEFPSTLGYLIHVQIVGIVSIETGEDPWGSFSSSREVSAAGLLQAFNSWRAKNIDRLPIHSAAHLLTGHELEGPIIGLAGVDTVCDRYFPTGVNQATTPNDFYVAKLLAHELGHSLGFRHTNVYSPGGPISLADATSCSQNQLNIMQPMIYSTGYRWDECAPRWFKMKFEGFPYKCEPDDQCVYRSTYGKQSPRCLETPSKDIFSVSGCGNGVLDPGEECDDLSKCCKGCKLQQGASCSLHDECCDPITCQTAPKTQLCRAKKGGCDISEYCDGNTFSCPPDRKDVNCTHEKQCLFLVGRGYSNILGECPRAGDKTNGDITCKILYCLRKTDLHCDGKYLDGSREVINVENGTPCGTNATGRCDKGLCIKNNTRNDDELYPNTPNSPTHGPSASFFSCRECRRGCLPKKKNNKKKKNRIRNVVFGTGRKESKAAIDRTREEEEEENE